MLRCDTCGVEQPANDYLYCVNCGHQIDTPTRVRSAYTPEPSQTRIDVPPPTVVTVKRHSPVPWIIAGLAAVVATAAIMYAIMRSPTTETAKLATPSPTATVQSTPTRGMVIYTPTPLPVPTNETATITAATNEAPRSASGWPPNTTALCNDGEYTVTDSASRACSSHGGVRKWRPGYPTTPNMSGPRPVQWPPNATALCNDGQFSFYTGTFNLCGTHGGVKMRR